MKSPSPQTGTLLFHWQTHWTSFVALAVQVVVLVWYLKSVRRLAGRGRSWSWFKTAGFGAGLLVAAYAVEGGLAYYARSNFTKNPLNSGVKALGSTTVGESRLVGVCAVRPSSSAIPR